MVRAGAAQSGAGDAGFGSAGAASAGVDVGEASGSTASATACDWSSDGAQIMVGFGDGAVLTWFADDVVPLVASLPVGRAGQREGAGNGNGNGNDDDDTLGQEQEQVQVEEEDGRGAVDVVCIAFAPGASPAVAPATTLLAAVATADETVHLVKNIGFDGAGGTVSVAVANIGCDPTWVSFSFDDTLLACAAEDGSVRVYDLLQQLPGLPGAAGGGMGSSSGGSGSGPGSGLSQSLLTEVATLNGHDEVATCCRFAPSSHVIISSSWDETVRIWAPDGPGGEWVGRGIFRGHAATGWVKTCAMHPELDVAVSASDDGTILCWDLPPKPPPTAGDDLPGGGGGASSALVEALVEVPAESARGVCI